MTSPSYKNLERRHSSWQSLYIVRFVVDGFEVIDPILAVAGYKKRSVCVSALNSISSFALVLFVGPDLDCLGLKIHRADGCQTRLLLEDWPFLEKGINIQQQATWVSCHLKY